MQYEFRTRAAISDKPNNIFYTLPIYTIAGILYYIALTERHFVFINAIYMDNTLAVLSDVAWVKDLNFYNKCIYKKNVYALYNHNGNHLDKQNTFSLFCGLKK